MFNPIRGGRLFPRSVRFMTCNSRRNSLARSLSPSRQDRESILTASFLSSAFSQRQGNQQRCGVIGRLPRSRRYNLRTWVRAIHDHVLRRGNISRRRRPEHVSGRARAVAFASAVRTIRYYGANMQTLRNLAAALFSAANRAQQIAAARLFISRKEPHTRRRRGAVSGFSIRTA